MIPYERQQRILELLRGRELVWLEELQEEIPGVSSSTLRRDIKELERLGKVEHLQGGAIKASSPAGELPLSVKSTLHADEKAKIAKLAAREVADGDTIYLDSGSTCTALMRELVDRDVTVVTSNTDVVALVTPEATAKVTLLGGTYDPAIGSISGPLTQENIDKFSGIKYQKKKELSEFIQKHEGVYMLLRTMSPDWIAVDEITDEADLDALVRSSFCGVRLLATAHVFARSDLTSRPLYARMCALGLFEHLILLSRDHTFTAERMNANDQDPGCGADRTGGGRRGLLHGAQRPA